jgi:penicillin-binding protein 2
VINVPDVPPGEAHAWFGSYARSDQPEIAIVAFCEHSGGGGKTAAPTVLEVMKAYFGKTKPGKPINP